MLFRLVRRNPNPIPAKLNGNVGFFWVDVGYERRVCHQDQFAKPTPSDGTVFRLKVRLENEDAASEEEFSAGRVELISRSEPSSEM